MRDANTVIEVIRSEHENLLSLCKIIEENKDANSIEALKYAVESHEATEEDVIFDHLRRFKAELIVEKEIKEHKKLHEHIFHLQNISVRDKTWKDKVLQIRKELERHIKGEEQRLFKILRKTCPLKLLESMRSHYLSVRDYIRPNPVRSWR